MGEKFSQKFPKAKQKYRWKTEKDDYVHDEKQKKATIFRLSFESLKNFIEKPMMFNNLILNFELKISKVENKRAVAKFYEPYSTFELILWLRKIRPSAFKSLFIFRHCMQWYQRNKETFVIPHHHAEFL